MEGILVQAQKGPRHKESTLKWNQTEKVTHDESTLRGTRVKR